MQCAQPQASPALWPALAPVHHSVLVYVDSAVLPEPDGSHQMTSIPTQIVGTNPQSLYDISHEYD